MYAKSLSLETTDSLYDSDNQHHCRIADHCGLAEDLAEVTMRETLKEDTKLDQIGLSKRIRGAVIRTHVGLETNDLAERNSS